MLRLKFKLMYAQYSIVDKKTMISRLKVPSQSYLLIQIESMTQHYPKKNLLNCKDFILIIRFHST